MENQRKQRGQESISITIQLYEKERTRTWECRENREDKKNMTTRDLLRGLKMYQVNDSHISTVLIIIPFYRKTMFEDW